MKYIGIITITATVAVTLGVLAFAMSTTTLTPDNNPTPTSNYNDMWKKVKDNLEKNLPESAEKELSAIELQASKDQNQTQLLKTYLFRQMIFPFTVE